MLVILVPGRLGTQEPVPTLALCGASKGVSEAGVGSVHPSNKPLRSKTEKQADEGISHTCHRTGVSDCPEDSFSQRGLGPCSPLLEAI